jgi:hypothetical protein
MFETGQSWFPFPFGRIAARRTTVISRHGWWQRVCCRLDTHLFYHEIERPTSYVRADALQKPCKRTENWAADRTRIRYARITKTAHIDSARRPGDARVAIGNPNEKILAVEESMSLRSWDSYPSCLAYQRFAGFEASAPLQLSRLQMRQLQGDQTSRLWPSRNKRTVTM